VSLFCVWTVGPGGSTDENGEMTLDALVMDGVMELTLVSSFPVSYLM